LLESEENKGLVANLRKTFLNAGGDFIWFLGDDDEILIQDLDWLLKVIRKEQDKNILIFNFLKHKNKFYPSNASKKDLISDRYHHGLMFISSLIYKKKFILTYMNDEDMYKNITLPLGLSILAIESGKFSFIDICIVDSKWGSNSWVEKAYEINSVIKLGLFRTINKKYKVRYIFNFLTFKSFYLNLLKYFLKIQKIKNLFFK
jgi:glycosyltransferase involved in cell wall biosynthesis